MAILQWDLVGERLYETGTDHGVLYPLQEDNTYSRGVAWNGLIGVSESPEGAEPNPHYADNIKYLNLLSAENLNATIEAFTYPDEFAECDGSVSVGSVQLHQQARKTFGMSYRTLVGNDTEMNDYGYKLHLLYGALAAPSERAYQTVNEPEALTFSWEVSTTPVPVTGHKPTALLTIDSTKATPEEMAAIEAILYGTEAEEARLPLPDEVISILGAVVTEPGTP